MALVLPRCASNAARTEDSIQHYQLSPAARGQTAVGLPVRRKLRVQELDYVSVNINIDCPSGASNTEGHDGA